MPEHAKDTGTLDVFELPDVLGHRLEERRITDVCGVLLPVVQVVVVRGEGKGLPQVVSLEDFGVAPLIHFGY